MGAFILSGAVVVSGKAWHGANIVGGNIPFVVMSQWGHVMIDLHSNLDLEFAARWQGLTRAARNRQRWFHAASTLSVCLDTLGCFDCLSGVLRSLSHINRSRTVLFSCYAPFYFDFTSRPRSSEEKLASMTFYSWYMPCYSHNFQLETHIM